MRKTWILLSFVACLFANSGCTQDESQPVQATIERISQNQGSRHHSENPRLNRDPRSDPRLDPRSVDLELRTSPLMEVGTSSAEPALGRTDTEQPRTDAAAFHPSTQHGTAAYTHARFHGRLTASGERYDQNAFSASHPTYPFGTTLRVTNLANAKSVTVRVNDRSSSTADHIVSVSHRAAQGLGLLQTGIAEVQLEVVEFGDGKTFHHPGIGSAAYYHARLNGRPTASGERYNQNALTAAHQRYPFGTKVRVTNLANDKSVVVRINDRGPLIDGRVIEVSRRAAEQLDFLKDGIAQVKVEVVSNAQS